MLTLLQEMIKKIKKFIATKSFGNFIFFYYYYEEEAYYYFMTLTLLHSGCVIIEVASRLSVGGI